MVLGVETERVRRTGWGMRQYSIMINELMRRWGGVFISVGANYHLVKWNSWSTGIT